VSPGTSKVITTEDGERTVHETDSAEEAIALVRAELESRGIPRVRVEDEGEQ
jgi:hypothetical protein